MLLFRSRSTVAGVSVDVLDRAPTVADAQRVADEFARDPNVVRFRKSAAKPANPFNPAPGRTPAVVVGRETDLAAYAEALREGPQHPNFLSYLIGARGYGKTVMLSEIGRQAETAEWIVIAENASQDSLADNVRRQVAVHVASEATNNNRFRSLLPELAVAVPNVATLTWRDKRPEPESALETAEKLDLLSGLRLLATAAAERGAGVLIAVDELQSANPEDVGRIGAVIQLVQGGTSDRWISFVGAGLPDIEEPDGLLEHLPTFMHRAGRVDIDALSPDESAAALEGGFQRAGLTVESAAVDEAVLAANGHPWYLQMVGYHTVKQAHDDTHVDAAIIRAGIAAANQRAGRTLFAPVWLRLSDEDKALMEAIATDGGYSSDEWLQNHLGWSSQHLRARKVSLSRRGLIGAPNVEPVAFTHRQALRWVQEASARNMPDASNDGEPPVCAFDHLPNGNELTAAAHQMMVRSLPSTSRQPTSGSRKSRCGYYGPIAKAHCIRPAGHNGPHRYR